MTAAQRVGEIDIDAIREIDSDAIRHSMTSHTETWSDGTRVRVFDEVHVMPGPRPGSPLQRFIERHRAETDEALRILRHVPLIDPSTGLVTYTQVSPAAASGLLAGAETEVPGAGIPPPRPGPPDHTPRTPTDLKGQQ